MADYQIYNSTLKHLCQSLRDQYMHNELIPLTQVPNLMNASNIQYFFPQECSVIDDVILNSYTSYYGRITSFTRVPYEQRHSFSSQITWNLCSHGLTQYKCYMGEIYNNYNYDCYYYTEYDKPIYLNKITKNAYKLAFYLQNPVRTNAEIETFYRDFNTCFFEYNSYNSLTGFGNGINLFTNDIRFLQYPLQWRSMKSIIVYSNNLNNLSFLNNYCLEQLNLVPYYYRGYAPQQENIPQYWTSIYAKDLNRCYENAPFSGQADLPCSALYCDSTFNNCGNIIKSSLPYNAINMYGTFNNCVNLEIVEGRNVCLPLNGFSYTFNNCVKLKHFNTLIWYLHPMFYTSNVFIPMTGLFNYGTFNNCFNLETLPDITTPENKMCYISSTQNLYYSCFANCCNLKTFGNWLCDITFYDGLKLFSGLDYTNGLNNLKSALHLKNVQSLTRPIYDKNSVSRTDYLEIRLNFANVPNLETGISGNILYSDSYLYVSEQYEMENYSKLKSPFYNFKTMFSERQTYYYLSTYQPDPIFDNSFLANNDFTINIGSNKQIQFYSYNINLCGNFYLFVNERISSSSFNIRGRVNYSRKLNIYIPRDELETSTFYNIILGANNGYVTTPYVVDNDSVVWSTTDRINYYNLEKNLYVYTYLGIPECFNQFLQ